MLKQEDLHIQISKTILNLGANEAYLYSILSKSSLFDGGAMVHLPQLAEMLGIGNRTENREKIKQSLARLESNLGLEYYTDFQLKKSLNLLEHKGTQYFYSKVPSVQGNFVKMSLSDLNKFVYFEEKECKQMIMFQFLYIVGMINERGKERKISYPTIEQIVEKTGFDRKTVIKYNEILTKYELIYIGTFSLNDKSKNIYSRWIDKEDVIEAVAEANETGHISKVRKKQQEAVDKIKKEVVTTPTTQKSNDTCFDPSIKTALEGFVKSGLTLHKATKEKINEAIKICGVEQCIIAIKELDFICRNNGIPESRWAGYFSNNIILKAKERKVKVDEQKKANEKLMNDPVHDTKKFEAKNFWIPKWKREGFGSSEEYAKAEEERKKTYSSLFDMGII